jgi:cell division protein FtsX
VQIDVSLMERWFHMIFLIIIIAVEVWLPVILSLIIYNLCATLIGLKFSLFYQIFITVSLDEQIIKYLLKHSQLEVQVYLCGCYS